MALVWSQHSLAISKGTSNTEKTLPYTFDTVYSVQVTLAARTCMYGGSAYGSIIAFNVNNTASSSVTVLGFGFVTGV